jgi:hypothetical protein
MTHRGLHPVACQQGTAAIAAVVLYSPAAGQPAGEAVLTVGPLSTPRTMSPSIIVRPLLAPDGLLGHAERASIPWFCDINAGVQAAYMPHGT